MISRPDIGQALQGLALVEVLIALTLLAGGAATLLRLQLQAMETQNENLLRHQAMRLAHDCMSRLLHAESGKRSPSLLCSHPPGWRLRMECRKAGCTLETAFVRYRVRMAYRVAVPLPRSSS